MQSQTNKKCELDFSLTFHMSISLIIKNNFIFRFYKFNNIRYTNPNNKKQ